MEDDVVGYFVWIRVKQPMKNGPLVSCQKWSRDAFAVEMKRNDLLSQHPLTVGTWNLHPEILEQRFPPPKVEE